LFNRDQVLHRISQDGNEVWGISVQPSSHKGDVFAAASIDDGVLRIFDIRCSTTGTEEFYLFGTDSYFKFSIIKLMALFIYNSSLQLLLSKPNKGWVSLVLRFHLSF